MDGSPSLGCWGARHAVPSVTPSAQVLASGHGGGRGRKAELKQGAPHPGWMAHAGASVCRWRRPRTHARDARSVFVLQNRSTVFHPSDTYLPSPACEQTLFSFCGHQPHGKAGLAHSQRTHSTHAHTRRKHGARREREEAGAPVIAQPPTGVPARGTPHMAFWHPRRPLPSSDVSPGCRTVVRVLRTLDVCNGELTSTERQHFLCAHNSAGESVLFLAARGSVARIEAFWQTLP